MEESRRYFRSMIAPTVIVDGLSYSVGNVSVHERKRWLMILLYFVVSICMKIYSLFLGVHLTVISLLLLLLFWCCSNVRCCWSVCDVDFGCSVFFCQDPVQININ